MMNSEEFIKLLSAKHYTGEELQSVSDVCRSYPMFNAAHMLKVRILERLKLEKEDDLRIAAVYAGDRKKLFEFVDPGSEMPVMEQGEEDTRVSGVTELHFLDEEQEKTELIIQNDHDNPELTDKELLEIDPEQEKQQQEEQQEEQEEDEEKNVIHLVEKQEADMENPADEDEKVFPAIDLIEATEDPGIDKAPEKVTEENKLEIIERFIKQEPGPIKADKQVSLTGDASINSVKENDQLITDTLAKIYVKQGLHAKAIYAYEKLSLKFPEKSAYFAAQIDKIKNGTNS